MLDDSVSVCICYLVNRDRIAGWVVLQWIQHLGFLLSADSDGNLMGDCNLGVYEELGVVPFINAYLPLTRLGGARLPKCVVDAMREASEASVDIRLLQTAVGKAIALLTQNEAAYVSCGAASGITLAVAAAMAGADPELSARLPNTTGMKNEVIMQKESRGYKCDVAVFNSGASIVDAGTSLGTTFNDVRKVITDRTAAILAVPPTHVGLNVQELVQIGEEKGIPVIVDAASLVPPVDNLWRFTSDGATCVIVSGGKGISGPQASGLMLGKTAFIDLCAYHGHPNDRIGRGMKVGKEELVGIYAAVKRFIHLDHASITSEHFAQASFLKQSLDAIPEIAITTSGSTLYVEFGLGFPLRPKHIRQRLLQSCPPVYVEPLSNGLQIDTQCLNPGEEAIVAELLVATLTSMASS